MHKYVYRSNNSVNIFMNFKETEELSLVRFGGKKEKEKYCNCNCIITS